jgi:3-oxoacyl-[acyl-carrier-protein] synthase-3
MRYNNVCIEGLGYALPDHVVTSAWIEEQLAPVYQKLRIPTGRLEYLTGIRERRWWDDGVQVSDGAAMAAERAIEDAGMGKEEIQCLVNASVCRDYLEPATAVIVHDKVGLSPTAINFDVGNACLGFLNGMVVVANMIELGQIEAGLVVAAENVQDGQLKTIERLLGSPPDKSTLRENLATFTLGSGAVAMVLRHRSTSKTGKLLLGGSVYGQSQHNQLCVAEKDWMKTNSSKLLRAGMEVISVNWEQFKEELGWDSGSVDRLFAHQVSERQRQIGLRALGLSEKVDFPTLHYLGNIASVSAPICMAIAKEQGVIQEGERLCLLGVGSGVNSIILGIQW